MTVRTSESPTLHNCTYEYKIVPYLNYIISCYYDISYKNWLSEYKNWLSELSTCFVFFLHYSRKHCIISRNSISQILRKRRLSDVDFQNQILFTEESCFVRSGTTNLHNEHVYLKKRYFLRKFMIYQVICEINCILYIMVCRFILILLNTYCRAQDSPVNCLPCSHRSEFCNFFIWRALKQKVYAVKSTI